MSASGMPAKGELAQQLMLEVFCYGRCLRSRTWLQHRLQQSVAAAWCTWPVRNWDGALPSKHGWQQPCLRCALLSGQMLGCCFPL
jgi:hypothetical protein